MPEAANEESEEERVSRLKGQIKFPAVRPANDLGKDIFNPQQFKHIDTKAREVPQEYVKSYDVLIYYLTDGLKTDLERLRSIYMWLGTYPVSEQDYRMSIDTNTPLGFTKRMKDEDGYFSSFFARLCWEARIPCEIVTGVAKGSTYEVGLEKAQLKTLRNSWNSVYVAGGWRLVFPLWSFSAVTGASKGNLTLVQDAGEAIHKEVASEGYQTTQLNEYYFLTNPFEFIHVAYPDDEKWQLISRPWTFEQFAEIPYCTEEYHRQEINIKSGFCGSLTSSGGECNVRVHGKMGTYFTYKLSMNYTEYGKKISDDLQLTRYVMVMRESDCWHFQVRFAETGVYKLEILGGGKGSAQQSLCEFKMTCTEVKENCKPVPLNPKISVGPCIDAERAGLKVLSKICVKVDEIHTKVEVRRHNIDYSCAELQINIDQTISKNDGECALQINTIYDEDEFICDDFENACIYILLNDKDKNVVKVPHEIAIHISLKIDCCRNHTFSLVTKSVIRFDNSAFMQTQLNQSLYELIRSLRQNCILLTNSYFGQGHKTVDVTQRVSHLDSKSHVSNVQSATSSHVFSISRVISTYFLRSPSYSTWNIFKISVLSLSLSLYLSLLQKGSAEKCLCCMMLFST
ncbi:hypothetical protein ACJMK2_043612 [Sinanodonta woodiana]|uniref:KY-like immunoglobulin-like domain-containing protein n=1 Tax=Sinanodonta woodiana TaxID=1069815 RepID=A0ABD3W114_SINWO